MVDRPSQPVELHTQHQVDLPTPRGQEQRVKARATLPGAADAFIEEPRGLPAPRSRVGLQSPPLVFDRLATRGNAGSRRQPVLFSAVVIRAPAPFDMELRNYPSVSVMSILSCLLERIRVRSPSWTINKRRIPALLSREVMQRAIEEFARMGGRASSGQSYRQGGAARSPRRLWTPGIGSSRRAAGKKLPGSRPSAVGRTAAEPTLSRAAAAEATAPYEPGSPPCEVGTNVQRN